ncbi:MAG: hypothetical protein QOI80_3205, partial [Solirubrobacteraceae bacterium]|nr:hypothetical protein [Solirubrobacteraceae bacterium]
MAAPTGLRRLAQRSTGERDAALEHCELCGAPIAGDHRHLLEVARRELLCACRACALLFDRPAAAEGRYKLVPERRLALGDLELDDLAWEELRLPVEMAFFLDESAAGRV